jgi:signal transduction histidine kinase
MRRSPRCAAVSRFYVEVVYLPSFVRRLRRRHGGADEPSTESATYRAALLRAIGDASADGIVVVAPNRRILSANPRMIEMWRVPPDVIASGSDECVLAWALDQLAEPDAFMAKVESLYDHPDERSWDEVVLKDGRIFERYSAPVNGAEGCHYGRVWFFHDVTARKQAERRVTKLRQDFAAAIVHDLRAPIQTILLQTRWFLRGITDGRVTVQESAVRRIEKQALQLSRMTTDLLDLTTLDLRQLPLQKEPIALRAFFAEVAEELAPVLDGHAVSVAADEPLPTIHADRQRLRQVLMNLLVNAAAYSPDGSPIDVAVRAHDGGVTISVRDRGRGIAPEELPHIFDRFYRGRNTRSARSGYGLGLHIAQAFVEAHGGRIDVDSTPGAGTRFDVWLPSA